jgi:hypothetical protein
LSVLDLINPRDLREPLLSDPADLRMPVLMTRAGLTLDRARAELVVVHEPYFGLLAPPLGEFSPLRKLLLENPAFGPTIQGRTLRNEQLPPRSVRDLGATQLGVSYVPNATTSAAIEYAQAYLFDDPARSPELHTATLFPVQLPQFALRVNQSLLRERLKLAGLVLLIGLTHVNAWAARAELDYALTDRFDATLGFVMYRPSQQFGVFYGFEHVDRVLLNLRWDVSG